MKMKPVRRIAVILIGITAIIWTVASVFDFIYDTAMPLLILRVLCAVIWYISFFVNLHRYRTSDREG